VAYAGTKVKSAQSYCTGLYIMYAKLYYYFAIIKGIACPYYNPIHNFRDLFGSDPKTPSTLYGSQHIKYYFMDNKLLLYY